MIAMLGSNIRMEHWFVNWPASLPQIPYFYYQFSSLDNTSLHGYIATIMDVATKAKLLTEGGKFISDLIKIGLARSTKKTTEITEEVIDETISIPNVQTAIAPHSSGMALPTSEETTAIEMASPKEITEGLKGWLVDELSEYEDDLSHGLTFMGKPCDCTRKHYPKLHSRSQELIPMEPGNTVYQDIQQWLVDNQHKVIPEAVVSGLYKNEYPKLASQLRTFRKRVMGSVGLVPDPHLTKEQAKKLVAAANEESSTPGTLTLAQAKKMAAEEAAKEVEKAWKEG